jgi:hypothetical protein
VDRPAQDAQRGILLHNIALTDAARQLDQRQVDLLIDTHLHSGQALQRAGQARHQQRPHGWRSGDSDHPLLVRAAGDIQRAKAAFPQILLHNIALTDAARQLDQRQVDLLIDTHLHSGG